MLRVALMWTINDFLTYGMLSRWMTQGKLACLICMEDTKTFTLKFGEKTLWFDCHRRFLETDHPYRCNKYGFRNNAINDETPTRLNGHCVWQSVRHLSKIIEIEKSIRLLGMR